MTIQTTTLTGDQDITLDAGCDVLRCQNPDTLRILSLSPGTDGQRLRIEADGQRVNLAASVGRHFVTVADTPLAARVGVAEYSFSASLNAWRLIAHEQGAWLIDPFDASAFTASGSGVWTVRDSDRITCEYYLTGNALSVNWIVGNTNVSGSPVALEMLIPGGFSVIHRLEPMHYWEEDDHGKFCGWFDVNPNDGQGGRLIRHYKFADSNGPIAWANTGNHDCSVHGSVVIAVK